MTDDEDECPYEAETLRQNNRVKRINHLVKILRDEIPADFEFILDELHLLALGG